MRAAVLETYAAVRAEGHLADRALDRVLHRETRLYSSERRAVAEDLYALLRTERALDRALFGRAPPDLPSADLFALRYAALKVRGGDDPAAVAARDGLPPRLAARLPRAAAPEPLDLSGPERVALAGSLPDFFADLLVREIGEEEAVGFARAIAERAPLTVRANALKTTREALLDRLAAERVPARPTPLSPLGLTLEARVNVFGLASFKEGLFEVQDEGSQLLAQLVQARSGERVVDACAGAGGKTLALAAQMRNAGELWALDVDADRLDELARRAGRAGAHNIRRRAIPPDAAADRELGFLRGKADRVLVDAPCTGAGALRRNPDARYRLKPDDFERHAARQRELLARFAQCVKPGGRLVYATCSVVRTENEDVVEQFLKSGAPFRVVPISEIDPALASVAAAPYLRSWPQRHGTDGFFAAVLRRGS